MSDEKQSIGTQLPTSEELRAAIGPELQALARQALQGQGADPPSLDELLGGNAHTAPTKPPPRAAQPQPQPILQPKTMPLAMPVAQEIFAKAQASAKAIAPAAPGVAAPPAARAHAPAAAPRPAPAPAAAPAPAKKKPLSPREIAARDAPTAKVKRRSSLPTVLLIFTGAVAALAAGGAVWQAKKLQRPAPAVVARAETPASNEGAVKFVVPARPQGTEEPAPADTTAPAEVKAAGEPQPQPPVTPAVDPAPLSAPATLTPTPRAHHARVAPPTPTTPATPAPHADEPKKTASADEKKPAVAPPPPTSAPSVDAILQQQLKSAIP